jgi:hypothetical protein
MGDLWKVTRKSHLYTPERARGRMRARVGMCA